MMRNIFKCLSVLLCCSIPHVAAASSDADIKTKISNMLQSTDFQSETQLIENNKEVDSNFEYEAFESKIAETINSAENTNYAADNEFMAANEEMPLLKVNNHQVVKMSKPLLKPVITKVSEPKVITVKAVPIAKPAPQPIIEAVTAPPIVQEPIKQESIASAPEAVSVSDTPNNTNEKWKFKAEPYFGLAHTTRHMPFVKGFGDNVFNSTLHGAEIYAGVKLWDYLGLEVGYTEINNRHKSVVLGEDFMERQVDVDDGEILGLNSTSKVSVARVNVLGFIPLDAKHRANILMGIGMVHLKTNNVLHVISSELGPYINEDILKRSFNAKQNSVNFITGFEYKILPHVALRGSVIFEKTSQIGALKPSESPDSILTLKHKNSRIYSIGINING